MTDLLWRAVSLVDLALLLGLGTAWQLAHRDHVPRPAWLVGWGFGGVVAVTAIAITVNAASSEPLTIGQKVFAVGLVPPTLWVLGVTVHEARAYTRRANAVLHRVAHLGQPLCNHPACIEERDRLVADARGDRS